MSWGGVRRERAYGLDRVPYLKEFDGPTFAPEPDDEEEEPDELPDELPDDDPLLLPPDFPPLEPPDEPPPECPPPPLRFSRSWMSINSARASASRIASVLTSGMESELTAVAKRSRNIDARENFIMDVSRWLELKLGGPRPEMMRFYARDGTIQTKNPGNVSHNCHRCSTTECMKKERLKDRSLGFLKYGMKDQSWI
jgi:hypothetical protein